MKIFVVHIRDEMGFNSNEAYYMKKSDALEKFNEYIQEEMESREVISEEDFAEIYGDEANTMKRECPLIFTEKDGEMVAAVHYWQTVSFEYNEQDIFFSTIHLKEVEVL